jgi:dihydroxyacid dehydratase/phosphogluconate dehydratase
MELSLFSRDVIALSDRGRPDASDVRQRRDARMCDKIVPGC